MSKGIVHIAVQERVKKDVEQRGYPVVIEKQLQNKRADLGIDLENGVVAGEICLSPPEHEFLNIKGDLDAGFCFVIACCKDHQQLNTLRDMVEKELTEKQKPLVKFFLISHYIIQDSESVCSFLR